MNQELDTEAARVFSPEPKSLMTTKVGRFFELWSYGDLLIATMVVLLVSTLWFSIACTGQGLNAPNAGPLDALYFSLVSFTSLGYGEYVPQGLGRIFAVFDVVSGLALTALLIGKLASERQNATLVLLHTSDCQRRISGFAMELRQFGGSIAALDPKTEQKKISQFLRDLAQLMEAISNYLIFNAMQARIAEFGNSAGLSILYRQLEETFNVCEALVRNANLHQHAPTMSRAFRTCGRIQSLLAHMCELHSQASKKPDSIHSMLLVNAGIRKRHSGELVGAAKAAALLEAKLSVELANLAVWKSTTLNPELTEKVFEVFPPGPKESWDKSIPKTIAKNIGVSNSLVAKTITILIADGRLPKLEPKARKRKKTSRTQDGGN